MIDAKNGPMRVGVIGWPVNYSRSPLIHNHWLAQYGIGAIYDICPIDPAADFPSALQSMAESGYVGANVTIPHKQNAFHAMDSLSPMAEKLGAVNTISFRDGRLLGDNTDVGGFIASLDAQGRRWRDGPALVLGAGGAARAIIAALDAEGVPEVRLVNRTRDRAEALAALAPAALRVGDWQARDALAADCGLLVNTTSLGMTGSAPLEMPLDALAPTAVVTDIVYTPVETDLLTRARAQGFAAIDGLGMLLHQAALSFDIWFGVKPEVGPALRAALIADLQEG